MGVEYDFLSYTSFPSSIKLVNDTEGLAYVWHEVVREAPIVPGTKITAKCMVKQKGHILADDVTGIRIDVLVGGVWTDIFYLKFPRGTFDWMETQPGWSAPGTVPAGATGMMVRLYAKGVKGDITWFDDLKVFQDGVLIYSNDFSNWNPVIGAGVGAPIGGAAAYLLKEPLGPMVSEVVGAVVGGALGGGIGLLTGLGIIPVPQIPALEATPEGPGAPARLGKYQITG